MEERELNQAIKPPTGSKGILQWLKENLFNTWYNTILTCLAFLFLCFVLKGILIWIFTGAKWSVIPANLRLFMVGIYPSEEIWRVWVVIYSLSALAGLSAGIWGGLIFRFALSISGVGVILALLPFNLWTRVWILGMVVLLPGFFFLGRDRKGLRPWIVGGWLLSFPWTIGLLHGFGILPIVRTTSWGGLLLTLILAAVGIVVSFPLGVLLAIGRRSTLPVLKWVSTAYIETVRGVPLVAILYMAQNMLPIFLPDSAIFEIDKILRAMVGITFFSAAYMAENVRGGLQAIPKGQHEAARALGLSYSLTMLFIILPQALRSVIPAIVGQFIALFKDTSLVAIIGLLDLLGIAKSVLGNTEWLGLQAEVYLFVAVIYFVFSYSMSYVSRRIETALGVGKI